MSQKLRSAKVSFKGQEAGLLEETTAGGTRFLYHNGWTETIACCLPVLRREHEWARGMHPFFQHLGAEGWLRERQARAGHVADQDDFGLLLRFGADCIGAVGVLPSVDMQFPPLEANEVPNPGRTVSGVQRKMLVVRDEGAHGYRPAGASGPAPYIAKFNSTDIATLVRNENLSLKWVRALLGEDEVINPTVAEVSEGNGTALVVKRFDRTEDGRKLRAEDFAQILCKPRGADFGGKYDASYEEVAGVIRKYSARPAIDLLRFYRRLVAFVLVSNADAHLKNFTLLETPEGLRLSPVYDVVNVGVYPQFSQQLALSIAGNFVSLESVNQRLLAAFGEHIGLKKAAISGVSRDLKKAAIKAAGILPNPDDESRDPFGMSYRESVRNACLRLLEE
ncbi:type II toxin-antitoxin system HipA family toxin [Nitrospirillum bahiense]|uniref:Serine/threonine-protein kinase HipA n=1 Tax=Nitrospirillum amazonense TaxID=28077 RepID=A0A560G714_9PROT|nr:HipA domain-containing protein [Nitrospirillum amazonense]TWB29659.1 serine/threonine-protein kinase HipA [Nitrospirillum amazonense]